MLEAIVLLVVFFVLLALGVPIAFSIGLATLGTMLVNITSMPAVTTVAQRMAVGLDSFALLAIPFFILAGQLMNSGGIARRLIDLAKSLVGPLPGGLAHVNVVAAMLFGSIAGSAVAAASAVGGTLGPRMKEEGYDEGFSAAVNITSSTTGLIIPPSNVMIVYSLASGGVSIAGLFLAGYLPGLLLGLTLMGVVTVIALRKGYPRGDSIVISDIVKRFIDALPSLFMLVVVIGGIVAGYFTATEASAVAVFYALVLGMIYKEIKLGDLPTILLETSKTTAIVMLLIGTSMGLAWVMAFADIPQNVSAGLIALADNPIIILLLINIILLLVGAFMDMTPAVLIFTPIFLPIAIELGIDPMHFGIMMILNLCIGLSTPPVGSILFIGCSIADISIRRVIRPLLPMVAAMLIALMIISYVPQITLWLPRAFGY